MRGRGTEKGRRTGEGDRHAPLCFDPTPSTAPRKSPGDLAHTDSNPYTGFGIPYTGKSPYTRFIPYTGFDPYPGLGTPSDGSKSLHGFHSSYGFSYGIPYTGQTPYAGLGIPNTGFGIPNTGFGAPCVYGTLQV